MTSSVQQYIDQFNQLYDQFNSNRTSMFKLVLDAYGNLSPPEFDQFRNALNADRSTINKIVKICTNPFVMKNLDKLPASWGTLTKIARTDDKLVENMIDQGELTSKTTLKRFRELNLVHAPVVSQRTNTIVNPLFSGAHPCLTLTPKKQIPDNKKLVFQKYIEEMKEYFEITGEEFLSQGGNAALSNITNKIAA